MGEVEGNVGERGVSVVWVVFFGCGDGISCAGRWIIFCGCGWGSICDCVRLLFFTFFSLSLEISSLSLLLFKLVVASICSSSEMCCFFFFFLLDETGVFIFSSMIGAGDDSVASVVLFVFTVVVVLTGCLLGELFGEFFFFLTFFVTCIHPSSSFLLGRSPISFIAVAVFFSVAVVVVVVVGEFIVLLVVVIGRRFLGGKL